MRPVHARQGGSWGIDLAQYLHNGPTLPVTCHNWAWDSPSRHRSYTPALDKLHDKSGSRGQKLLSPLACVPAACWHGLMRQTAGA